MGTCEYCLRIALLIVVMGQSAVLAESAVLGGEGRIDIEQYQGLVLDRMPVSDNDAAREYCSQANEVFHALQADFGRKLLGNGRTGTARFDVGLEQRLPTPSARRDALLRYLRIRDQWLHSGHYGNFMLAGELTACVGGYLDRCLSLAKEEKRPVEEEYGVVAEAVKVSLLEVCSAFDAILEREGRNFRALADFTSAESVCPSDKEWRDYIAQFCMAYIEIEGIPLEALVVKTRTVLDGERDGNADYRGESR